MNSIFINLSQLSSFLIIISKLTRFWIMGNTITINPCCAMASSQKPITLILSHGSPRSLIGRKKWVAGEIMFEFPECMVCHADGFFIGQPIPALAVHDRLVKGKTYFVIPIDRLAPSNVLSAANLSCLSPNPGPIKFGNLSPFEYLKGDDGRVSIKVAPEFITRIVTGDDLDYQIRVSAGGAGGGGGGSSPPLICSTPELQKRYDQVVVKSREHVWSPKLETISEHKIRFSPCRFIGLEWKQKER